jgi:membrane associated rhomboid family serine protease/tetratricopeptide (TPR) repeat protein
MQDDAALTLTSESDPESLPETADEQLRAEAAFVQDPGPPLATCGLFAAIALAFVAELALGLAPTQGTAGVAVLTLMALGGLSRSLVLEAGEWHRLLTAAFLHADLLHLVLNAAALYMAGPFLEGLLGRAWFLTLFLTGALGGSIASLALNSSEVLSVGASGAIMALCAAAFVSAFRFRVGARRLEVQQTFLRVLVPSLLPIATHRSAGEIDFGAHLGGAATGALLGYLVLRAWPQGERRPRHRPLAAGLSALLALGLALGLVALARGYARYQAEGMIAGAREALEKGSWSVAIKGYSEALRTSGATPEQKIYALLDRGFSYGRIGDAQRQIADYSAVIEMPDVPAGQRALALFNRGAIHGQMGESEREMADYAAVIRMPDAPAEQKARALVNRGFAQARTGDVEEAMADYDAVVRMKDAPADQRAMALLNRGVVHSRIGDEEKTMDDYTAVIRMPDAPAEQKAMALNNRGLEHVRMGDGEKAIADYVAVIRMPDAPADQRAMALLNRGVASGRTGNTGKEIADYSAVVQMPDAPADQKAMALVNRGVASGRMGNAEKEIADYSTAIRMPDAPTEQKAKALLFRGITYGAGGDTEKARADYSALVQMVEAPEDLKARAARLLDALPAEGRPKSVSERR